MKDERTFVDKALEVLGYSGLVVLVFILLAWLQGCASDPVVHTEIQKVEVEVQVPCKPKAIAVPAWPLDAVAPGADVYTLAAAALAEVELRIGYERQLSSALKGCQ